ncbi:MAG: hypothetical protein QW057_06785 [Candidatus Bathyarchaeia archaeon]
MSGDGRPTSSGMTALRALKDRPLSPEEVARRVNQSLPRVRSGLREFQNAGFVEEAEGRYRLSGRGAEVI